MTFDWKYSIEKILILAPYLEVELTSLCLVFNVCLYVLITGFKALRLKVSLGLLISCIENGQDRGGETTDGDNIILTF